MQYYRQRREWEELDRNAAKLREKALKPDGTVPLPRDAAEIEALICSGDGRRRAGNRMRTLGQQVEELANSNCKPKLEQLGRRRARLERRRYLEQRVIEALREPLRDRDAEPDCMPAEESG